jgi:hypothetical protein
VTSCLTPSRRVPAISIELKHLFSSTRPITTVARGRCSVYDDVRATSPLLDYPLEGSVDPRSFSRKLPEVVLDLPGPAYRSIAIEMEKRVDSAKGGLWIRFEKSPRRTADEGRVKMAGAKKSLFQNSTNICKGTHRATLALDAQSGKVSDSAPKMKAQCGKKGGGKK